MNCFVFFINISVLTQETDRSYLCFLFQNTNLQVCFSCSSVAAGRMMCVGADTAAALYTTGGPLCATTVFASEIWFNNSHVCWVAGLNDGVKFVAVYQLVGTSCRQGLWPSAAPLKPTAVQLDFDTSAALRLFRATGLYHLSFCNPTAAAFFKGNSFHSCLWCYPLLCTLVFLWDVAQTSHKILCIFMFNPDLWCWAAFSS